MQPRAAAQASPPSAQQPDQEGNPGPEMVPPRRDWPATVLHRQEKNAGYLLKIANVGR